MKLQLQSLVVILHAWDDALQAIWVMMGHDLTPIPLL